MERLLCGQMDPITFQVGFIEADFDEVARAFCAWQERLFASSEVRILRREVSGALPHVLGELLPLTSYECRRYLLVPTDSDWVAFLDNGHRGPDVSGPMSHLAATLRCRSLRIVNIPDTRSGKAKDAGGRFGALELQVYGPEEIDSLNYVRTVHLSNQGDRWEFIETGVPFEFENREQYRARRTRDRFSLESLREYAGKLGLRPFDQGFYLPASRPRATLVFKEGPHHNKMQEYSLEEARRLFV